MSKSQLFKEAIDNLRNGEMVNFRCLEKPFIGLDVTNQSLVSSLTPDDIQNGVILMSDTNMLAGYIEEIPDACYQLMELEEISSIYVFSNARNVSSLLHGVLGYRTAIVKPAMLSSFIQRFRKPIFALFNSLDSANMNPPPLQIDIDQTIQIDFSKTIQFNQDHSFKIIREYNHDY